MTIIDQLTAQGFEQWQTGGGCTARVKVKADGFHVVVTAEDGAEDPDEDSWLIGLYPSADWEPEETGSRYWPANDADAALGFEHCLAEALK